MLSTVRRLTNRRQTPVERYWGHHTVKALPFKSAAESAQDLEWRFAQYPLFRELMDLWGSHDGETILDYGCGPGNDVTGFLLETGARCVLGADISARALRLAASRLALHEIAPERYRLLRLSDADPGLPLADRSVDYVHCAGVIQHTTSPERVLHELARTLRPGGRGRIMVYNRDSLYFHLYTAYERRVLKDLFHGLTAEEAFARNTDGPDCPISRAFRPAEFCRLAEAAGFEIDFLGGYFAGIELDLWRTLGVQAVDDPRLADEHRDFLRDVDDSNIDGYPRFHGQYAGVGGVYAIRRPSPW
jgi:SAM-dependent methyltransferase